MKIVYVGDNRNRLNYGCRATSTALSQLISKDHEIVGRVHGNFRNSDTRHVFYTPLLGSGAYSWLGERKHWPIFKEVFIDLTHIRKRMRVAFSNNDFITMDFDKSIERLKRCIPANELLKECDLRKYDFDALVVNGEGSFIFSSRPWRESMVEAMLMHWAKQLGKKVYFLNGMFSASPGEELNTKTISLMRPLFESIDFVGVRESQSLEFATNYFPNAKTGLYPDALFTWSKYINENTRIENGRDVVGASYATDNSFENYDFTEPYICISGSSSSEITKNRDASVLAYSKLIQTIKEKIGIKVYIVIPCEIDNFLIEVGELTETPIIPVDTPVLAAGKILANARAYVTGRYHPSILASLGGTPCIFMGSNSHKNFSLQKTMCYSSPHEYSAVPTESEINMIVNETINVIQEGNELRQKLIVRSIELSSMATTMTEVLVM